MSTAVAQWLEDQGGFPLFTIEGEEPEVAKLSWDLPNSTMSRQAAQGAADVAEQFGDRQQDQKPAVAVLGSPSSRCSPSIFGT